jgi:hypothetical protein
MFDDIGSEFDVTAWYRPGGYLPASSSVDPTAWFLSTMQRVADLAIAREFGPQPQAAAPAQVTVGGVNIMPLVLLGIAALVVYKLAS